jgi:broad specificity phosphatase PhoE
MAGRHDARMATRNGPAVLLVRHGETEWSRDGRHTGRSDLALTDAGRRHAEALGARLAGREFALVLTSPLQRARKTAAIVGLGDQAEVLEELREYDYGCYEGRRTVDIRNERPGWDFWRDGTPDGESHAEVGARADRVIARVIEAAGDVAIFAHGHFLRTLGARWMRLPPEAGGALALGTAALCDLGFERERRVVWSWNDTSHGGGR